jgi:hypothetical protein
MIGKCGEIFWTEGKIVSNVGPPQLREVKLRHPRTNSTAGEQAYHFRDAAGEDRWSPRSPNARDLDRLRAGSGAPKINTGTYIVGTWGTCDVSRGCPFDPDRRSWLCRATSNSGETEWTITRMPHGRL